MRVVARALCVRYATGVQIGPIHLDLGPGLWHLVGPNGAGKTTVLRCLCGASRWSSGEVMIDGQDPLQRPEARAKVGFLPAEIDLPDVLRVDELWQMAAALRGAPRWDGRALRDALGLPGKQRLGQCSSGQRARAGLLVALAGDPPVLLLDEPWSHLDTHGGAWLGAALAELRRERVVLITSHSPPPVVLDGTVGMGGRAI